MTDPILLRARGLKNSRSLSTYRRLGGYAALEKALSMTWAQVIDEVKASGVRGRGGAGFPAGVKWSFVPKDTAKPKYMICNADESEPGTFKDRELILVDPHMILEGIAIASYAIDANTAFIYIRGEFVDEAQILVKAIAEAKRKKFLGKDILGSGYDLEVHVHRGAGAYICGEETALIESIEGKRGLPRLKPPFPAVVGVFGCPTVVNNVETLACVPHILEHGGAWFAGIGTERSTGPKLFCVSGHVERPGVYEAPMGITFREIIEDLCGGMRGGRNLKAFIPGGSSAPVLPANLIDTSADFESVAQAGSMLGSGGLIVMDETVDMVWALENLLTFYAHESCGQCTPCREGSAWTGKILKRIEEGRGTEEDLDTLMEVTSQMEGTTICVLSDSVAAPVQSSINKFKEEYLSRIRTGEKVGVAS